MHSETIFALSSGIGRAGVAVIRVSGPHVEQVYSEIAGGSLPAPRRAILKFLKHPVTRTEIDQTLVLFFKGPASFTGEDCLELQVHGGRAVIQSVLDALSCIDGLRPAEPGEFTRRAFENGKMDLTAAEGLNDLIHADTAMQQSQALAQSAGRSSETYESWRSQLIALMAQLEADLDFSDEDDVPANVTSGIFDAARQLKAEMGEQLQQAERGEIIRDGYRVALVGPPNVGKSSLLNALARRDAAIVSDEPGTTRDVIEIHLDLEGLPVTLTDTAGLRETDSHIEREGIRRTEVAISDAHLVLWIQSIDGDRSEQRPPDHEHVIHVLNKIDQAPHRDLPPDVLGISAIQGTNLDQLVARISENAHDRLDGREPPIITRERHRFLVQEAMGHLDAFIAGDRTQLELRAEDLRIAANRIGRITGRIDVEEMLGEIFSTFCIGK